MAWFPALKVSESFRALVLGELSVECCPEPESQFPESGWQCPESGWQCPESERQFQAESFPAFVWIPA